MSKQKETYEPKEEREKPAILGRNPDPEALKKAHRMQFTDEEKSTHERYTAQLQMLALQQKALMAEFENVILRQMIKRGLDPETSEIFIGENGIPTFREKGKE